MNDINCVLCEKNDSKVLFESKDLRYNLGTRKFSLVQCNNCELIYLNPMPSNEVLKVHYPDVFYSTDSISIFYSNILDYFKIKKIERYQKNGLILDVGCGKGHFLKKFQDRGWQCFGNDLSEEGCRSAKKRVANVFQGQLSSCNFEDNKFDLVMFNHSFEHITSPQEEIIEAKRILRKDGWLHLGLPNIGGNQFQLFKELWVNLEIPRHCYHYSPETISKLLEKNNFTDISISYPIFETPLDIVHSLKSKWRNGSFKPQEIIYALPLIKFIKKWRGTMDVFARKN